MANYATALQALAYAGRLSKTTTDTTTPSLGDLDQFLGDAAQEVDTVLASRGFPTPAAGPPAFVAALASLTAKGAAAHLLLAAFGVTGNTYAETGALLLKEYSDGLMALRRGEGVPVGLSVTERDTAISSIWTDAGATGGQPGQSIYGDLVSARPIFALGRSY